MKKSSITQAEYAPFYQHYFDLAIDLPIVEALSESHQQVLDCLDQWDENQWNYAYAKNKWSIAEMVQHMMDTERVFAYRALMFARNEKTNLPGFDQDPTAASIVNKNRSASSLLYELKLIRATTICLFENLTGTELNRIGHANGADMSARALGFIISGHEIHHVQVLQEKYKV